MNLNELDDGYLSESDELEDENCCPDLKFSETYQYDSEFTKSLFDFALLGVGIAVLLRMLKRGTVNVYT